MDKIWHLKRFNFFTCLSQSEMVDFSRITIEKRFSKKEMIFLPGDKGDKVYLQKSGVVKLSKYSDHGKEVILSMVNPGEIFGEMALIDDSPRSADAMAKTDCVLAAVDERQR